MSSNDLLKKCGYKKRYTDSNCIIFDLVKEIKGKTTFPETIIISRGNYNIEFTTENTDRYVHLGSYSFSIDTDLLFALQQKIEDLKIKDKRK